MKNYQRIALSCTLLAAAISAASGQSMFQNLGFEMADVSNPDYLSRIPFANALPYWEASGLYDDPAWVPRGPITSAYYNAIDMDQMTVGIYDASGPAGHQVFGTYTAYIEADLGPGRQYDIELSQTGLIPAGARSISFISTSYTSVEGVSAQLSFSVNGITLPCLALDAEPTFTQWAADVSAYAGTTNQVCFTVAAQYPYDDSSQEHVLVGVGLDNIAFSTTVVPEPGCLGLFAVGALVLAGAARRGGLLLRD